MGIMLFLGGDKMFQNQVVVMLAQLREYTESHGVAHLKGATLTVCELNLRGAVI